MLWVARESWPWLLLSGFLGAALTCAVLLHRGPAESAPVSGREQEPVESAPVSGSEPGPVESALVSGPGPDPGPVESALVSGPGPDPRPVESALVSGPGPDPRPVESAPVSGPGPDPRPVESAPVSGPGPDPRPVESERPPEPDRQAPATPLPGGAAPEAAYVVKAKRASRLFHPPESPSYARTVADLWFTSEDAARTAGYFRWDDPQRPRRSPARTSVPRID